MGRGNLGPCKCNCPSPLMCLPVVELGLLVMRVESGRV